MRKMFLLVFIFLLSFTLISCGKETKYIESLSDEIKNEIKLACATKNEQDIKYIDVEYFLGGFDDKYVIILSKLWEPYLNDSTEKIAEYEFNYYRRYCVTSSITVYYNNDFYSLQEAVDNKLLTIDNIKIVKENFDNIFKEYDEEFFKITNELKEQGLTENIYLELRKVYPNNGINMYLGKYNDAYVALYLDFSSIVADYSFKEYNGYVFEHHFHEGIRIIKDGKGYEIDKAIEQGIVDKEVYEHIFMKKHNHSSQEVGFHDNNICVQTLRNILKIYYEKYNQIDRKWNFSSYEGLVKSTKVYGESIVLKLDFTDIELNIEPVVIEGITYTFPNNTISYVYYNNDLYTIEDAYSQNIIDINIVQEIFK